MGKKTCMAASRWRNVSLLFRLRIIILNNWQVPIVIELNQQWWDICCHIVVKGTSVVFWIFLFSSANWLFKAKIINCLWFYLIVLFYLLQKNDKMAAAKQLIRLKPLTYPSLIYTVCLERKQRCKNVASKLSLHLWCNFGWFFRGGWGKISILGQSYLKGIGPRIKLY